MKKTVKIILILICSVIPLCACHRSADYFTNFSFTHSGEIGGKSLADVNYIKAGSADENYELYFDEKSLAVYVTDKNGKKVLDSCPVLPDGETDNGLNLLWENYALSAASVYYSNEKIYKPLTSFSNAEISARVTLDGFTADVNIRDIGLKFTFAVSLSFGTLNVTVPYDSIVETGDKPLIRFEIYPFMNATRGLSDGFILVPDGNGAVIDTSEKTSAKEPYSARFYGDDLGVNPDALNVYGDVKPHTAGFSAFGVSGNNGKFLCSVGSAEYANVTAYKSGVTTDYNFAYASFIYRETYFMPTDNKGNTVQAIQADKNRFDAQVKYRILKSGALEEMAEVYSSGLNAPSVAEKSGDIPLKADFFIGDSADATVATKKVIATRFDFISKAIGELDSLGVKRTVTSLLSFSDGGASRSPRHYPIERKAGGNTALKNLTEWARSNNAEINLMCDYSRAYNTAYTKARKSYGNRDLALSRGKRKIATRDYGFPLGDRTDEWLRLDPTAALAKCRKEYEKLKNIADFEIAVGGVEEIYSSYTDGEVTRTRAKETVCEIADTLNSARFVRPPDFLYGRTKHYYSMPYRSSQFNIARKSVPFLSMVLSSHAYIFGEYMNLNNISDTAVLKHIEYGLYPSFAFTQSAPKELSETSGRWLYSSKFSDWKDKCAAIYNKINGALKNVSGARFVSYKNAQSGVYECGYSNGVSIIVNYNGNGINYNGNRVDAMSYAVIKNTGEKL